MDEDLILREIVKSLAFEIEAINQDNVFKWTTTNGTPLSVKVRVRNKDEPRLVQRGAIPVPRIGITTPEQLRLVSSDQTILSFRVFMENELQKKANEKRNGGFKIFNIGTYSDDEGPYLPSSSNENTLDSGNDSKSGSAPQQKPSAHTSTSKMTSRNPKKFLGKCKPGGCLDPPFDEDNYAYGLPKTDRQQKLQHEISELEDDKKSCKPGGCLDPPFGEEKYPYVHPKQNIIIHEIKDNTIDTRKNLERSSENETSSQKPTKEESDRKNYTNIHARVPDENALSTKQSNSIITYPTEVSSNGTLDQTQSKKVSVKSVDNESLRKSYDYPESYFVPPKDVKRYKEEDRRNVSKLSTEQLFRSSKMTAHDSINKSKIESISDEFKYMPQKTRKSKEVHEEQTKVTDLRTNKDFSPEVSIIKKESNETFTKLSNSIETPLRSENVDVTNGNTPIENETNKLKIQQQIMRTPDTKKLSKSETGNLEDNTNAGKIQVKMDKQSDPDRNTQSNEIKSQLRHSRDFPDSKTQILDKKDANVEKIVAMSKEPVLKAKSFDETDTQSAKIDDVKIPLKEAAITCATLPIGLTVATMMKSDEQPLQSNDKPKINHLKTKDEEVISLTKMYSKSNVEINNKQRSQEQGEETKSVLSHDTNFTKTNKNDVASSLHNNSKLEASITDTTSEILEKFSQKRKQLSTTRNVITEKKDTKDNYIKHSSEPEGNKTSAILQKKPYITRQGSDIHNEDINRLKRNTFTIIGSETSLLKRDEDEERTENITNVLPTSNDNANFVTPGQTDGNKDILDKKNTKIDNIIQSNSTEGTITIDKQENFKDVNSHMNDKIKLYNTEYDSIMENPYKKSTEKSANKSITDLNDNSQHNFSSNYQEKTSSSLMKRESLTEPLQQIPTNIGGRHSKTLEDDKSTLSSQIPLDEVTDIKTLPIVNQRISNDFQSRVSDLHHDNLAPSNEYDDKHLKYVNYINSSEIPKRLSTNKKHSRDLTDNEIVSSTQISNTIDDLYTKGAEQKENKHFSDSTVDLTQLQNNLMSAKGSELKPSTNDMKNIYSEIGEGNKSNDALHHRLKTENLYKDEKTLEKNKNAATGIQRLSKDDKYFMRSNSIIDDKSVPISLKDELLQNGKRLSSDLSSKPIPQNIENPYANAYDKKHSFSVTRISNTQDNVAMENMKMKNESIPGRSVESSQSSMTKIENADSDKIFPSGTSDKLDVVDTRVKEVKSKSNLDIISTRKSISVHDRDIHSVFQRQENLKYDETAADDLFKMESDIVQDLHAQTADDSEDVFHERIRDTTHKYQDTKSNQPQVATSDIVGESRDHSEIADIYENKAVNQIRNNSSRNMSQESAIKNENGEFYETFEGDKLMFNSPIVGIDMLDTVFQESKNKNDDDVSLTQKFKPNISSDLLPVSTGMFDDRTEPKNQTHNEQGNLFYDEVSYQGSLQEIKQNKISSDQVYNSNAFLDTESNEPRVEVHESDVADSDLNFPDTILEFQGKIRSVSKKNSPFSGYSGQISEVLSNISENVEGEETYSKLSLGYEAIKINYVSNTQSYNDHEILNKEIPSIAKEPKFIALTLSSDNTDAPHEEKYVDYDVSRYSLAESDMSLMKEGDDNIPMETIAKAFETTEFVPDSPEQLEQRSNDYPTDTLNMDRYNVVHDKTMNVTDQSGEYQLSKRIIPVNTINELNTDYLAKKSSLTINGPLKHDRQHTFPKFSKVESMEGQRQFENALKKSYQGGTASKKDTTPLYLDMSFYSYMNDNNQRVVQTQSPLIEKQPPNNDGTVTVVKTLIRHGNEIRIPVDKENDLSLNILDKNVKASRKGSIAGISIKSSRREKRKYF